ncbi:MAG: phosphoenolpyruvate carboxylase [bacterium]|nr:phosphoenolpyruvate carboxylase [bacterium]
MPRARGPCSHRLMSDIPPIHRQVNTCASLLGEAVTHAHGREALALVESLRKQAAQTRGTGEKQAVETLFQLLERVENLSPQQALLTGKAFSIYLLLINACENAYRTSRLRTGFSRDAPPLTGCLIYVLTAHPTEIRSAPGISISRRITGVLTQWFARGPETEPLPDEKRELSALIRLLWQTGIHKHSPVVPAEEVDHIAGQFSDDILCEILALRRRGADLRFRTWVGGDKDGHPGINAVTLHTSFRRTRQRFYHYLQSRLDGVREDLRQLGDDIGHTLEQVERALLDVRQVTSGDGMRMNTLRRTVETLAAQVKALLGECPLMLVEMTGLLDLFPGLVLPVELREESDVFLDLQRKKGVGTIGKMLRKADQIALGGQLRHYAQGLIVSMTRRAADLEAAADVVERTVGRGKIPVIPLFERGQDLDAAPTAIDALLRDGFPILADKAPDGRSHLKMEIMLGYSDTSKRIGAFAGRMRIIRGMHQLAAVCKKHGVGPTFFHGAGGSVTRGGGSIEEQFAAWPPEARQIIKFTVQGEMVARTLATPEILRRNVERLLVTAGELTAAPSVSGHGVLDELANVSAAVFEELVNDGGFKRFVASATPYPDLCVLHLGSRPSHRPGKTATVSADLGSLRAIPWVLCFTQTRLLVPSWYGIGTAFQQMREDGEKLAALKNAFDSDKTFRGFVKLMGFSLAKGDRAVFSFFADALAAAGGDAGVPGLEAVKELLLAEEKRVADMVTVLSGREDHLWFRPWLAESILLRGSTIHPLSVIEVSALRNRRRKIERPHNDELLRIAIAGTAVGMLTTG